MSTHPRPARRSPRRAVGRAAVWTWLVLGALLVVPSLAACGHPAQGRSLRSLAAADHKYVGSAVDDALLGSDATYTGIAADQFDAVTPENEMKWASVEATRGSYDWAPADRIVDFARAHGELVRGHNLVWHSQLPAWVTDGTFTSDQLRAILRNHILTEVGHFKGRIYAWDVVNEPFDEDGTLKPTLWEKALGPGYIADALRWAHEADPKARLYLNDYGIEGVNAKSDAAYALVRSLTADHVPISGIGLESHFALGDLPGDIRANMRRFAALGVDTAVTELDVRMALPSTADGLARQASDVTAVADACLAVSRCVGITVWGFDDGHSWVPGYYAGYGAATPYDVDYRPKPAYGALADALAAAASPRPEGH